MSWLIGKHEVYSLEAGDSGPVLTKMADVDSGEIICGASGSPNVLYYVSAASPETVQRYDFSAGHRADFVRLPAPTAKMVYHRNKLYCAPAQGTCIMCVDPLNLSVDSLDTHHQIADFEPADHGFVIEDKLGSLYGFHFNYGTCKVPGVGSATLLGHFKRYGVAVTPSKSDPVGVSERGGVIEPPLIPAGATGRLVAIGDAVFTYSSSDRTIRAADGSGQCALPASVASDGIVALCAVPAAADDGEEGEVCTLCFCEFEGDGDEITLDCGHRFHKDCVMDWVGRWKEFQAKGTHVAFTNAVCPGGCKHLVRHPLLCEVSEPIRVMFENVTAQSKKILQGMLATKVEDDLLFYICSKCQDPFYGGEKVCFRAQSGEPTKDPVDLVCDNCCCDFSCLQHQREWVVYKCSYCCNPATERSFGNRYLCERCSARWTSSVEPDCVPCPGPVECPLGGHVHEEKSYPIGCLLCLTAAALDYSKVLPAPQQEEAAPPQ